MYGTEARWEVLSVQRRARSIQNGVVCLEVDQRITSSESDIIDIKIRGGPRIEHCGTPIETARDPDNRPSD